METPTLAASFILVIMALTTSSASLMNVPPSRWRLLLLFMAFRRASMMSKSDMKLQLQTNRSVTGGAPQEASGAASRGYSLLPAAVQALIRVGLVLVLMFLGLGRLLNNSQILLVKTLKEEQTEVNPAAAAG